MRTALLLAVATLASASALAQSPSQTTTQPLPDKGAQLSEPTQGTRSTEQRTERIVIEDAGSRVDELRVGGQTRSITVQPKVGGAMPPYEVRPSDGTRLWNLGRF